MKRTTKFLVAAITALCGFGVLASTNIGHMQVYASVTPGCSSLSVSSLNFGTVPASAGVFDTTATVTVTCNSGVPYDVRLGNGNNSPLLSNQRRMTDGLGNYLNYVIAIDPAHTTGWYDGIALGTARQSGTGTGAAQSYTAYGEAAPTPSMPSGSYSDSVEVDLNF